MAPLPHWARRSARRQRLYTPCIAAVASVKREMGGRWATVMVVNQCVVAWLAALVVRFLAVAVL